MSLAMKAADDIKSFANKLRPLFDAAEALEKLGNLEQLHGEIKGHIAASELKFKKADELFLQKKGELAELEKTIVDAKDHASIVLGEADAKAEAMLLKAKTQALEIVQLASKNKADIIQQANKEKIEIDEEIKSKMAIIEQLEKEIQDKKNRVALINKELEAAKSKISAFMRS